MREQPRRQLMTATSSQFVPTVVLLLGMGCGAVVGCTGMIGEAGGRHAGHGASGADDDGGLSGNGSPNGAPGSGSRGSNGGNGGPAGTGGGSGSSGSSVDGGGPAPAASLVTTHIRLMNNDEYNNTVAALLGDK